MNRVEQIDAEQALASLEVALQHDDGAIAPGGFVLSFGGVAVHGSYRELQSFLSEAKIALHMARAAQRKIPAEQPG